jgi:hypothetical protein
MSITRGLEIVFAGVLCIIAVVFSIYDAFPKAIVFGGIAIALAIFSTIDLQDNSIGLFLRIFAWVISFFLILGISVPKPPGTHITILYNVMYTFVMVVIVMAIASLSFRNKEG